MLMHEMQYNLITLLGKNGWWELINNITNILYSDGEQLEEILTLNEQYLFTYIFK